MSNDQPWKVTEPAEVPVAVRGYTVPQRSKARRKARRTARQRTPPTAFASHWPEFVLVFDTETTTDPTQRLLYGCCRVCRWVPRHEGEGYRLETVEEMLFGSDDPEDLAPLLQYARNHAADVVSGESAILKVYSRAAFVEEVLLREVYLGRALCVGFNLPFDLSRLAVAWAPARARDRLRRFSGGFSFVISADFEAENEIWVERPTRPRVLIKHVDRNQAFIAFASCQTPELVDPANKESGSYRGLFLDLKTLVFGLTAESLSLDRSCKEFGLQGKLRIERHGVITPNNITYCRRDVQASAELLEQLRDEFDRHPVGIAPWEVYSPASMAKATLKQMGVTPPRKRTRMIGPKRHGAAMSSYFGGRTEARIRHSIVPVELTDAAAMYPSVNTLMGNRDLLIAKQIRAVDATQQAREALSHLVLDGCFDPASWPLLRFIAEIKPAGDMVPVRARYDPWKESYTVGVNPFTSKDRFWYTGFDLAASALLTGRVPQVIRAFAFVGEGVLDSLRPLVLRGHVPVDLRTDDLFRLLVEERARLASDEMLDASTKKWLRQHLKTVANSGAYGIMAQFDRRRLAKEERAHVRVFGRSAPFDHCTNTPEDPGPYCFPPLAALITGGARLMLACIERLITDMGGTYLFMDTDSVAIVAAEHGGLVPCPGGSARMADGREAIRALTWTEVEHLQAKLDRLKPYGADVPHLLKIEEVNVDHKAQIPLFGYMISAKRYCLFSVEAGGRIQIRKSSEHGLGAQLDPSRPPRSLEDDDHVTGPDEGWMADVWRRFVAEELGLEIGPEPSWFSRPAVMRLGFTSPELLAPFMADQAHRPYASQIKPFNFMLAVQLADDGHPPGVDPERCRFVAPFEKDPARWGTLDWVDLHSDIHVAITTRGNPSPGLAVVKTIGQYVAKYHEHPESKSADAAGRPCTKTTKGLLQRRHVTPLSIVHCGKEANELEAVEKGQVNQWTQVREIYVAPKGGIWEQEVLPLIRRIPAAQIAEATGLSPRTIHRVRNSGRPPSSRSEHQLEKFARAYRWCEQEGLLENAAGNGHS